MWPGFDSRTRRHMWVEFVVGSRPCSERFFSGYSGFPLSSKTNISKNSNSIWTQWKKSHPVDPLLIPIYFIFYFLLFFLYDFLSSLSMPSQYLVGTKKNNGKWYDNVDYLFLYFKGWLVLLTVTILRSWVSKVIFDLFPPLPSSSLPSPPSPSPLFPSSRQSFLYISYLRSTADRLHEYS